MSSEFSLADAEASLGPDDWDHMGREVHEASVTHPFSPEQTEFYRALFATVRVRPANPAADAA